MDKTLLRRLLLACGTALYCGVSAHAQSVAPESVVLAEQARLFVQAHWNAAPAAGASRIEIQPGVLDSRLRLNACEQVQPYLPTGTKLWGRTRVGLRCVKGVTPWNVYLPVTVHVYGMAVVAAAALPAGHVLEAADLRQAEVNLAEDLYNPVLTEAPALLGRSLARALQPGQGLRSNSLKPRQWFAPGDQVQVRVAGKGFAVAGSGEALTAGMEGQPVKVRTETGRVLSGMPVGERQVEIAL